MSCYVKINAAVIRLKLHTVDMVPLNKSTASLSHHDTV